MFILCCYELVGLEISLTKLLIQIHSNNYIWFWLL